MHSAISEKNLHLILGCQKGDILKKNMIIFFCRLKKLEIHRLQKQDYELTCKVGEIIELLKEENRVHKSLKGEGYSQEAFVSSVDDFAPQLNKKSHFLYNSAKEFIGNLPEKVDLLLLIQLSEGKSN